MIDDDMLTAAADLVGRTGATGFEVGYIRDGVPTWAAGWYAHATYQGARVTTEEHAGPDLAAEALARRLMDGAVCKCGRAVVLGGEQRTVQAGIYLPTGERITFRDANEANRAGCRWTRKGPKWTPSCNAPPLIKTKRMAPQLQANRAQRRKAARARRRKGRR